LSSNVNPHCSFRSGSHERNLALLKSLSWYTPFTKRNWSNLISQCAMVARPSSSKWWASRTAQATSWATWSNSALDGFDRKTRSKLPLSEKSTTAAFVQ
jgi:hypothetical protein